MFSLGKKLGLVGSLSPNISRKARREKTVKRTQEEGYFWLKIVSYFQFLILQTVFSQKLSLTYQGMREIVPQLKSKQTKYNYEKYFLIIVNSSYNVMKMVAPSSFLF